MVRVVYKDFRPLGGNLEAMRSTAPEVLLHGPAGTGKSFMYGHLLNLIAESVPGVRILVVRKTMTSLRESWQVTFEQKVLPPDHPALRGPSRHVRTHYDYPNGSTIVLGGMDNKTRIFSTEYDVIYVNEAIELTEDEWESMHRALRNNVLRYQQLCGDTNPGGANHWLKRRMDRGVLQSVESRHEDNPSITPEYLERLSNLSGPRRDRLYLGLWRSSEGLVYPMWDPHIHKVGLDAPIGENGEIEWDGLPRDKRGRLKLASYFGAIDWGFSNPGCLQVWGVDYDGRLYRVAEWYATQKTVDWWAERVFEADEEYDLTTVVCDHDPNNIAILNSRLGRRGKRPVGGLARPTIKAKPKHAGWQLVRDAMTPAADGKPRWFIVNDALRGRDPELDEAGKPCCLEEELDDYSLMPVEEDDPVDRGEKEDPTCPNHAADAAMYAALHHFASNPVPKLKYQEYRPNSAADVLDHAGKRRRAKKLRSRYAG
jgi:phage terminase large subunit